MKTVRAGMLRHVVIFQRSVETQGVYNQVVSTWTNLLQPRAFIKPLSGAELWVAEHLRNQVSHQVIIRDPRTIRFDGKDRIIFGTRIFDIISVLNFEERQMHLNILCKERYDEVYAAPTAKNILTEDGFELLTESSENLVTEH